MELKAESRRDGTYVAELDVEPGFADRGAPEEIRGSPGEATELKVGPNGRENIHVLYAANLSSN